MAAAFEDRYDAYENGSAAAENSRSDRERSRDRDRGDRLRHREDRGERYEHRERRSHRDRDRDRDRDSRDRRRSRRRSRSHSKSRTKSKDSRSRSRSRSGSEDRRAKRTSGFDVPPPTAGAAGAAAAASVSSQPPGFFPPVSTISQQMVPFALPAQTMTQQATRHARQVYVGGLPGFVNEHTICAFFNQVMATVGGNTAGPGDVVVNVYINQEKKFAFVEMRTVEEASNAMALDGISFQGVSVRVRRPSDYNPSVAANLGPSQPNPNLNLSLVGLTPGAGGGVDGPDRIFVGGLPYYLTEPQIRELLESFGPLRGFDLVKDRDTGNSKGYGFCVYQESSVTDVACAALNGLKMGDRTLTVRRATANGQQNQDHAHILSLARSFSMNGVGFPDENPTKVLCLKEAVVESELIADAVYDDILEDMREECGKFGTVVSLVIPRPSLGGDVQGVGKVFVEFEDTAAAVRARQSLHNRKFDGRLVIATYYAEDRFAAGDYKE